MKAFKVLFRDVSGAEYAMAAAVVIAFVVIAASAKLHSTPRGSPCCGPHHFEDYRGPRARAEPAGAFEMLSRHVRAAQRAGNRRPATLRS
jgi:hypothetical protein